MNLPQILDYIQHPSKLGTADIAALGRLAEEFPYCHISHILLTKALHDRQDIGYHARLKKTAIHIPDRSVLYWLTAGRANADEAGAKGFQEPILSPDAKKPQPLVPHVAPRQSKKSAYETLMARLEELNSIPLPQYEGIEIKIKDIQKAHEQRLEKILHDFREELSRILRPPAPALTLPESGSDAEAENALSAETADDLPPATEISGTETPEIKDETGTKRDIIERFITVNPGISRPKKEFYNPVNMAHKSTEDPGDLVSETLAEIHLKQGSFDKALTIFAKLILLIPEKSAYFAARIEKIRKENNLP